MLYLLLVTKIICINCALFSFHGLHFVCVCFYSELFALHSVRVYKYPQITRAIIVI